MDKIEQELLDDLDRSLKEIANNLLLIRITADNVLEGFEEINPKQMFLISRLADESYKIVSQLCDLEQT